MPMPTVCISWNMLPQLQIFIVEWQQRLRPVRQSIGKVLINFERKNLNLQVVDLDKIHQIWYMQQRCLTGLQLYKLEIRLSKGDNL